MQEDKERLTRDLVTFRKRGKGYRRRQKTHVLRLYARAVLTSMPGEAGFKVITLNGYGPTVFPAGLTGFIARKAAT